MHCFTVAQKINCALCSVCKTFRLPARENIKYMFYIAFAAFQFAYLITVRNHDCYSLISVIWVANIGFCKLLLSLLQITSPAKCRTADSATHQRCGHAVQCSPACYSAKLKKKKDPRFVSAIVQRVISRSNFYSQSVVIISRNHRDFIRHSEKALVEYRNENTFIWMNARRGTMQQMYKI